MANRLSMVLHGPCRWAPVLLLCLLAGCGGGMQPVRGKVLYDDGTPVTSGTVVFESQDLQPGVSARGDIQADGSFELSTASPGDGVPPGKYRVLVEPQLDINSPQPERDLPFDKKFRDFRTSGLEYEVKRDSNEYTIRVGRPLKSRR